MYTSELPEYLLELITTQAVKAKREALSIAEFNYRESASRAIDTRVAANIIRKYARIFQCNHSLKTVSFQAYDGNVPVWCSCCQLSLTIPSIIWVGMPSSQRSEFQRV